MTSGAASLIRLYLNSNDRVDGRPLYEAIVNKARDLGLAGASVFSAEIGYGRHGAVHDTLSEYAFVGTPLVIEVVDLPAQIDAFVRALDTMIGEGLVTVSTLSPVRIMRYV